MAPGRQDLGSWLEGTPSGSGPDDAFRGGFRRAGPGALAPLGRRAAALTIDWALCLAVSGAFFASADAGVPRLLSGDPTATLVVFALSTVVLVSVLGHTVGHRVLGLRVARVQRVPREAGASAGGATAQRVLVPGPPGLLAGALRTLLLCLVIPAVVWGADGRGLHDVAAGTVIVRR